MAWLREEINPSKDDSCDWLAAVVDDEVLVNQISNHQVEELAGPFGENPVAELGGRQLAMHYNTNKNIIIVALTPWSFEATLATQNNEECCPM